MNQNNHDRDELPEMEFERALCVLDAAIVKVRQHAWPQSMELEMARKVLADGRLCRAGRGGLSADENRALDGLMASQEYWAGDVDGAPPRIEDDEDAYWAYHNYHAIRKLRRLSPQAGGSDE